MTRWILTAGIAISFFSLSSVNADELHEAARDGDLELLKPTLANVEHVDARDEAGETPLILAAIGGHLDVVETLIDAGADMGGRNQGGLTPLHAAAYAGHLDVARWLVEQGAQVNDNDNFYQTTPLHMAAEENHKDIVEMLLAHGAAIDAEERNGYTPLTQAGWREYWDVAGILMQAGATCQPADLVGEWLFEECKKRQ